MNAKRLEGNNNLLHCLGSLMLVGTALILFVSFYLFLKELMNAKRLEGNNNLLHCLGSLMLVGTALILFVEFLFVFKGTHECKAFGG
ncbi:Uncharacterised protein [Bergeyella zoohelcum]|uniref:Uncharacterized protein n=1 Tax=Bergeyella zoohelcum TaxID=1015 RepID=A0A7Z8YPY8_9FLAO|nr:Uncharacterised protein [Bergeyella zoohelcum]